MTGLSTRPPAAGAGRRGERGASLLECAAALALAGVVLTSTSSVSLAAAALLRHARAQAETIDVVRNLLEHELGMPCAAAFECPAGYRCSVTRAAVTAIADRLTASVVRDDGAASEALSTLAPSPPCGS